MFCEKRLERSFSAAAVVVVIGSDRIPYQRQKVKVVGEERERSY